MATAAEVYESVRAHVGGSTTAGLGALSAREAARFETAVQGSIEVPAGVAPDPGAVHPLYLSSVLSWGAGPAERDLLPDGNASDPFAGVDLGGLRLMGGGQELTFHQSPKPGTEVTMEVSISDVSLRHGRQGDVVVLVLLRRYFDEHASLLSECRESFLAR